MTFFTKSPRAKNVKIVSVQLNGERDVFIVFTDKKSLKMSEEELTETAENIARETYRNPVTAIGEMKTIYEL